MASASVLRCPIRNPSSILPSLHPNPIVYGFPTKSGRRQSKIVATALRSRVEFSFSSGTHLIPHPKKADTGGEDAFLVSNYNGGVLAVADGVSGWAERNVNPALFSQELMKHASSLVEDEEVNYDPVILLKKAHAATSSRGSATVCYAGKEWSPENCKHRRLWAACHQGWSVDFFNHITRALL